MIGARPFTIKEVVKISKSYRGRMALRNRSLILIGVNTGFRISELLRLQRKDVIDPFGEINDQVKVERKHMKRKKSGRTVPLTQAAKGALRPLLLQMEAAGFFLDTDYLFRSTMNSIPITRQHAWRIIRQGCLVCHITGPVSTHSLRKTFAQNVHNDLKKQVASGKPMDVLLETSKALGHADVSSTTKYLSFDQENLIETIERVGIYG